MKYITLQCLCAFIQAFVALWAQAVGYNVLAWWSILWAFYSVFWVVYLMGKEK